MNITPETAHGFNTMVETMQAAGHNMTLGMMEIDYPWPFGRTIVQNTSAHRLYIGLVGQRYSNIMLNNLQGILEGLSLNRKTRRVVIECDTKSKIESNEYKKTWKNIKIEPNDLIMKSLAIIAILQEIPINEIYYIQFHLQTGDLQEGEITGYFDFAQIDKPTKTITWYHYANDLSNMSDDSGSEEE